MDVQGRREDEGGGAGRLERSLREAVAEQGMMAEVLAGEEGA